MTSYCTESLKKQGNVLIKVEFFHTMEKLQNTKAAAQNVMMTCIGYNTCCQEQVQIARLLAKNEQNIQQETDVMSRFKI